MFQDIRALKRQEAGEGTDSVPLYGRKDLGNDSAEFEAVAKPSSICNINVFCRHGWSPGWRLAPCAAHPGPPTGCITDPVPSFFLQAHQAPCGILFHLSFLWNFFVARNLVRLLWLKVMKIQRLRKLQLFAPRSYRKYVGEKYLSQNALIFYNPLS